MIPRHARPIAALLLALALAGGCAPAVSTSDGDTAAAADPATAAASVADAGTTAGPSSTVASAGTHEDPADYAWDAASEVAVTLADGASAGGSGVKVDGDVVTITRAGTYRLRGTLSDGQVVVDAADEGVVRLVLDGVDLASSTGAALAVLDAGKAVVILEAGSQSTLVDAATYVFPAADVDEPNAALFSAADLTIAGDGALAVAGRSNDGIASKDGLIIAGGEITVDAVDDGIRGKDYLVVTGGTLDVTAGGDALKADNEEDAALGYVRIAGGTLDLDAATDGIDAWSAAIIVAGALTIAAGDDAIHSETRVEVNGGTIDITRSYEGLEGTEIVITGGAITLVAEDDGLNVAGGADGSGWQQEGGFPGAPGGPGGRGGAGGAGGGPMVETPVEGWYVEISGGTLVIDAGGDGLDSNGSATVTGGTIVVNGPLTNREGALDVNGDFLVSDAVLVAAGSIGMDETPSASSSQATLHLRFDTLVAAGTVVRIQAPDGTPIATFRASKDLQSLVVSTPGVVAGASYEVLTGGTVTGESLG
ncbi:MAG: carbohydrate-binding domain-containing protein, partial [Thermoleophilia bacterium]|nr:carbohydrate-binding domain-containing protein [Thermoleophilia bacterium]